MCLYRTNAIRISPARGRLGRVFSLPEATKKTLHGQKYVVHYTHENSSFSNHLLAQKPPPLQRGTWNVAAGLASIQPQVPFVSSGTGVDEGAPGSQLVDDTSTFSKIKALNLLVPEIKGLHASPETSNQVLDLHQLQSFIIQSIINCGPFKIQIEAILEKHLICACHCHAERGKGQTNVNVLL